MRFERSITSISWIPSDSIPGLLGVPFSRGVMHFDPPPPLQLGDLDEMRARGEFRFANRCRAYVDVDDGRITDCGYTGGTVMGLTPVTAGPLRIMLPTKRNHEIQWRPAVTPDRVTFVQTAGGRPGFSVPQTVVAVAVPGHEAVHDLDDAPTHHRRRRQRRQARSSARARSLATGSTTMPVR